MIIEANTACCIVFGLLQVMLSVQGGVIIELKLLEFDNPTNRLWNGDRCDYTFKPACDNALKLCVDHPNRPASHEHTVLENCDYFDAFVGEYDGSEVNYGEMSQIAYVGGFHRKGYMSNPLKMTIATYDGGFSVGMLMLDDDPGDTYEKIDEFLHEEFRPAAAPSFSSAPSYHRTMTGSRTASTACTFTIQYKVYCDTNYFTSACDVFCETTDSDVLGHHTCDADTGKEICIAGYKVPSGGNKCTAHTCDHHSAHCNNEGECIETSQGTKCLCKPGFTGVKCSVDIQECESNPCVNGTCVDEVNGYKCICNQHYTGQFCHLHVCDNPETAHCQNNGVCIQGDASCSCPAGFSGKFCEIDACKNVVCQNGGVCKAGGCQCQPGYQGTFCTVDECSIKPCDHGSCESGSCHCDPGYTGPLCTKDLNDCIIRPCLNNATCIDEVNGFQCKCLPDYEGDLCQYLTLAYGSKTEKKKSQNGLIGGVIGACLLILIVIILLAIFCRRRRKEKHPETGATIDNPLYSARAAALAETNHQNSNNAYVRDEIPQQIAVEGATGPGYSTTLPPDGKKVNLESAPPPKYRAEENQYSSPHNPPQPLPISILANGGGSVHYDNPKQRFDDNLYDNSKLKQHSSVAKQQSRAEDNIYEDVTDIKANIKRQSTA